MKTVKELRESLVSILKVDGAMRTAAMGVTTIDPRLLNPGAEERLQAMAQESLRQITEKNGLMLATVVGELMEHDSRDAVIAIKRLFKSNVIPYRMIAIRALGAMSTPESSKAIEARTRFWAFADPAEKELAKALLAGVRAVSCASCSKALRPFAVASGSWSGTVEELGQMKIEPDHGFVCDSCRAVICPVCSGKKASELGVREFVCTQCGTKPLRTIYRAME